MFRYRSVELEMNSVLGNVRIYGYYENNPIEVVQRGIHTVVLVQRLFVLVVDIVFDGIGNFSNRKKRRNSTPQRSFLFDFVVKL